MSSLASLSLAYDVLFLSVNFQCFSKSPKGQRSKWFTPISCEFSISAKESDNFFFFFF